MTHAPSTPARRRRGLSLFAEELAKPDAEVDIARASLHIALHHTPSLDVEAVVARLDEMGLELQAFLPPPESRYTRRMLLAINRYLFEHLGFRGAPKSAFYSVGNSCLDVVLSSRTGTCAGPGAPARCPQALTAHLTPRPGIPLTLSLVYMQMAQRAGLPMVGVNLPAHFMIRPAVEDVEVLVDPYNGGEIISVEDAEALLSPLYGEGATIEIDRSFFKDNAPKPRSFLTRMLTNLKVRQSSPTRESCQVWCMRAVQTPIKPHSRSHAYDTNDSKSTSMRRSLTARCL